MSTARRGRLQRLMKWTALTLLVLTTALWAQSAWFASSLMFPWGQEVAIGRGSFGGSTSAPFPAYWRWDVIAIREPQLTWWVHMTADGWLSVPLWMPWLALALLTAGLWSGGRGDKRLVQCVTCDYELQGLVTGVCPECGTHNSAKPSRG